MHLPNSKATVVQHALNEWQEANLLSNAQTETLRQTIHITPFDWRRLARYSFWFSIGCLGIAVSALLMDQALMELIELYFKAPAFAKGVSFTLLSALFYGVAITARARSPERHFRNEALFFLGVLTTAIALYYLTQLFTPSENIALIFLVACLVYGGLGLALGSPLIWVFALLSLGSWLGAETGYVSGWGAYYLGMNYPLRFTLFGGALVLFALLSGRFVPLFPFYRSTLVMGLLYLFISLWILSIFGNYGDMKSWLEVKQARLFLWSLLFALTGLAAIIYGLKTHDAITRGFGVVFLLINLYTRFFEYFWNPLHKAIFFAILGGSFWYLGNYAEKMWHATERLLGDMGKSKIP